MTKTPNLEKPVPNNLDAERSVLGAVLVSNNVLDEASDIVKPGDFFLDSHRRIFNCMLLLAQQGKPIDLTTLTEFMHQDGQLEPAGGAPYLASLADGMPRISNVRHYAEIVKEKSSLRSFLHTAHYWSQHAFENAPIKEVLDGFDASIAEIRERELTADTAPMHVKEVVKTNFENIEKLMAGDGKIMGLPTGYKKLDQYLAGWISGDFVVLGARPSSGKTALSLEFAYRQALQGNAVLIFSLEMTRTDLLLRLISLVGGINAHHLRAGMATKDDCRRILDALGKIVVLPLWISDPTKMWSSELVSKVRFFAGRYNIKLVVLDYLQLLRARTGGNRVEEVSKISQDVKEASRILGKVSGGTLLACAQLSRVAPDEEPTLDKLRESGAIEQDSDVVMFIWNAEKDTSKSTEVKKFLGIKKQRNGPTGRVPMLFHSPYTAFEEVESNVWGDHAEVEKERPKTKIRKDHSDDDFIFDN